MTAKDALALVLDQVDYTRGACSVTENDRCCSVNGSNSTREALKEND